MKRQWQRGFAIGLTLMISWRIVERTGGKWLRVQ
jgi:hypothetical protein